MTLDAEDIAAIAKAVAAEILNAQRVKETQQYMATLPVAERKKMARQEMLRQTRERKSKEAP